jgi:hypothetical protein
MAVHLPHLSMKLTNHIHTYLPIDLTCLVHFTLLSIDVIH